MMHKWTRLLIRFTDKCENVYTNRIKKNNESLSNFQPCSILLYITNTNKNPNMLNVPNTLFFTALSIIFA